MSQALGCGYGCDCHLMGFLITGTSPALQRSSALPTCCERICLSLARDNNREQGC
jgi:hypothetical protein